MATRQGKHKPGKVRMGIYVEPKRKAIAILAAQECSDKMTMTDILWEGVKRIAIAKGIIDKDENVTEAFKDRLAAAEEIVKQSEVNG